LNNRREILLKLGSLIGKIIKPKFNYLVIEYHDIDGDPRDPFNINIELFIEHLNLIEKSDYEVISLDKLVDNIKNDEDTSNMLVITFDDGFKNHLYLASKLLKEYHFPATFFININPSFNKENYNRKFMNLNEISKLSKNRLFTLGNHTFSHKPLSKLEKNEIFEEIKKAHNIVREKTGIEMKHLCPPGGAFKKEVWEVAKKLNYKSISIGTPKFNFKVYKNPYIIERIAVHYLNKNLFKKLLGGELNLVYYIYKNLKF